MVHVQGSGEVTAEAVKESSTSIEQWRLGDESDSSPLYAGSRWLSLKHRNSLHNFPRDIGRAEARDMRGKAGRHLFRRASL